jgi:glyoxylase-like metal-dependent hydrolase (beta-lactamase superfamily II)
MTYTGHVEPGGPAEVRELPGLIITKLSVGPMDNNTYLLRDRATDRQLLIDAANEPAKILELIGPDGVEAIVTTHSHLDHVMALVDVTAATGAQTLAGADDAPQIQVPQSRVLVDGDTIELGRSRLQVIHLRGHTPGAIALYYDDPLGHGHLFSGDSLFPGGPGRTTTPEDFQSLMTDLEDRVFHRFPDETWVYPGHGDDTTIGVERPQIPQWWARGW